jgi:hypothetical protein
MGVRREKAALFQSVQVPTRRRLQPEATGAAMEVTKLHGVHLRYGLHTRAATVFRDTLSEGFSYASKRVDAQADPTTLSGKADTAG